MEEEDKKAERDLEILKKYQKKEAKDIKFNTLVIFYGIQLNFKLRKKNIMSQRYSGKSRKDSSTMKKSKLSLLEKRKIKREKKKKRINLQNV